MGYTRRQIIEAIGAAAEGLPVIAIVGDRIYMSGLEVRAPEPPPQKPYEPSEYGKAVLAVPNLAGYWPCDDEEGSALSDRSAWGRYGTYEGETVRSASSLPAGGRRPVEFAGPGHAQIEPGDAFSFPAFTLSLWFRLSSLPAAGLWSIVARERPGFNHGDFALYVKSSGELSVQFQEAAGTQRTPVLPVFEAGQTCNVVVRADAAGFDAFLNGRHLGRNDAYRSAWSGNDADLLLGWAPQLGMADRARMAVSDVAVFDRALSDAEVEVLCQRPLVFGEEPEPGAPVYVFQPQASWIDGVPLKKRDQDDVLGPEQAAQPSPNRWVEGALVGGALVKKVGRKTNWGVNCVCWNRAPTGHPSLEMYAETGVHGVVDAYLQLWDELSGWPRHVRVAMELKTSKPGDATTYKANGLGPAAGAYPSYQASYHFPGSQAHQKYFCHLYSGNEPGGPINVNWWGDPSLPITRTGWMIQPGAGGQHIAAYLANFNRPSAGGGSNLGGQATATLADPGVNGCWHRIEIEVHQTSPDRVPAQALVGVKSNPSTWDATDPDGFVRVYLTPDIDNELGGGAGARRLVHEVAGLIMHPRTADYHERMNIGGPWLCWYYGGSGVAAAPAYAWIRRIEVCVLTR